MNATNRGVNRVILFLVGAVLAAAGGAVATAALWPVAAEIWKTGASAAVNGMRELDEASRLSEATTASGFTLGILALLLLLVAIAAVVIARLGGGGSSVVIRDEAGEGIDGAVTIRQGFASDALSHALASDEGILSSRANARRVRGEDVLHVSVTPRQNTSPADVARAVTTLVDNLATLTGRQTPTVVSIRSGIRSRLAADRPRVN